MEGAADIDSLRAAWRSGARPSFYYFWGHRAGEAGRVGKWCLSQWWPVTFVVDGSVYQSAEHFMMAAKARLFGDNAAVARILATTDPAEAKKIGRTVRGFDDTVWKARRYEAVVQGNLAKFGQHPGLGSFLMSVREDVLVEASPVDRIWGIGVAEGSRESRSPELWRGLNLLGFALTDVRRRLRGMREAVQQGDEADER